MELQLDAASRVTVAFSGQPKCWVKTYSLKNLTIVKNMALSKEKEIFRCVAGTLIVGSVLYNDTNGLASAGTRELMVLCWISLNRLCTSSELRK